MTISELGNDEPLKVEQYRSVRAAVAAKRAQKAADEDELPEDKPTWVGLFGIDPDYTPKGQEYRSLNNPTRETTPVWVCGGCGAIIADRDQHNLFHTKTRSAV